MRFALVAPLPSWMRLRPSQLTSALQQTIEPYAIDEKTHTAGGSGSSSKRQSLRRQPVWLRGIIRKVRAIPNMGSSVCMKEHHYPTVD